MLLDQVGLGLKYTYFDGNLRCLLCHYINEYAIQFVFMQIVSNSASLQPTWTGYIFTYSKYITYKKAHRIEGSFILKKRFM